MTRPTLISGAENIVAALLPVSPAEAKKGAVRSFGCSVFLFVFTVGYASDSNYSMCMN